MVGKESSLAEETEELPLLKSPMFTRAPFIILNEAAERCAYYSVATNIVVYLTGTLNMANSAAASSVQIWSGTCYITPLLGAFLSDAYWGRFWTILSFSVIYLIGLVGLALSAGVPGLHPTGGEDASSGQLALFWTAMYLMALGTGGIKPCVSSFGADQFNEDDPRERKLIPKFFSWFYFAINVGAIVATTVVVNVQTNVSWAVGFIIPAGAFVFAIAVFLIGAPLYRRVPPGGSPLTRIFRVFAGAVAHREAQVPKEARQLHEVDGEMSVVPAQKKLPRWVLEKAAVNVKPVGAFDCWLVTLTEVEELKCVIRLLPIFLTLIIYNAIYAQMTSLFVMQGETMDTALGSLHVAAATVNVLDSISVLFWVAAYELVIEPWFRKIGRPISTLQRIGWGYVVAILSMVAAAVVEIVRLQVVTRHNLQGVDPEVTNVPMSVWWQIPQYFLVGMSEALAMVGSLELFYSQAPDAMRSTCSALQLVATAAGNYLAAALVANVQAISGGVWIADNLNDGHMDYFFWLLAVLQALALVAYVFVAKRFRYRTVHTYTYDGATLELGACGGRGPGSYSMDLTGSLSLDMGTTAAGMIRALSWRRSERARSRRQLAGASAVLTELCLYGEGQVLLDCLPAVFLFTRLKALALTPAERGGRLSLAVLQPLTALEYLACDSWEHVELGTSGSSSSSGALLPQLTALRCEAADMVNLQAAPPSLQQLVFHSIDMLHLGEGLQLPQAAAPSLHQLELDSRVDGWPPQQPPPFHAMTHLTKLTSCSLAIIPQLGSLTQLQHLVCPWHAATALTTDHIEWLCCLTSLQRIGFDTYRNDRGGAARLARRLQVRALAVCRDWKCYLDPKVWPVEGLELDGTEDSDLCIARWPLSVLESLSCNNWEHVELSGNRSSNALLPQLTSLRCINMDMVDIQAAPPSLQHLVFKHTGAVHLGESLQLPQVSSLALKDVSSATVSWPGQPQLVTLRALECREMATTHGLSALSGLTSLTVGQSVAGHNWDVAEALMQAAPPSLHELAFGNRLDMRQPQQPPTFHNMPHNMPQLTNLTSCSLAIIPHLGYLPQLQHLDFPHHSATALTLDHVGWLCSLTSLQQIGFCEEPNGGPPLAWRLQVRG
ncbi:hypothetical protein N2152v2_009667 [Parachlorella kessleri]